MEGKVLVIQEARLGDLIQSGPLIERLRKEGASPMLLVRPGVVEGAKALNLAAEVVSWPDFGNPAVSYPLFERISGARDFVRKMRRESVSRVIVLNHHGTGVMLARLLGVPVSGFDHLFDREDGTVDPLSGWPAYLVASSRGVRALNRIHLSDMWQGFSGPGAFTSQRAASFGEGSGPTVVVLGGRSPFRRLAPSALSRLVGALLRIDGHPVLLSGGPEDRELGEAIEREYGSRVKNTAGLTGLSDLVSLVAGAGVVLSPDTATLHLAASMGIPTVGLFFASALPFETGAYREGAVSVVSGASCYPCAGEGSSCASLSCRDIPEPEVLAQIVAGIRRGEPAAGVAARLSEFLTGSQLYIARETPSGLLQEAITPVPFSKEQVLAILLRRFVVRYLNPEAPLLSLSREMSLAGMSLANDLLQGNRGPKVSVTADKGRREEVIDPLWFVRLERGIDLYLGLRERSLHPGERERMVERLAADFPAMWPLLHHLERVEGGRGDLPGLLRAGAALSWEAMSAGRILGGGSERKSPEKEERYVAVR
ncbi:MAG: glycosyltransferase family 9 protein [Leptospirillia bacterium]